MPLIAADFSTRLSGGAANAVGNAALGGVKSANAAATTLDALFDQVTSAQAAAGLVEYRCVYLSNNNATSDMLTPVVFISSNTPNTATTIDVGVGSAAVNGSEQTIANEGTAPVGVTFSAPATTGTGLALGNIPATQHKAIWLRRTITAGALATANDAFTINYSADFTS